MLKPAFAFLGGELYKLRLVMLGTSLFRAVVRLETELDLNTFYRMIGLEPAFFRALVSL